MQRRALGQHQRSARVTQLVGVPVAKPGIRAQLREVVREIIRVDRRTDVGSEDQTVIPPKRPGRDPSLGLAGTMLAEPAHQFGRERKRPSGLGRLEFRDHELHPLR